MPKYSIDSVYWICLDFITLHCIWSISNTNNWNSDFWFPHAWNRSKDASSSSFHMICEGKLFMKRAEGGNSLNWNPAKDTVGVCAESHTFPFSDRWLQVFCLGKSRLCYTRKCGKAKKLSLAGHDSKSGIKTHCCCLSGHTRGKRENPVRIQ